MIDLNNSEMHLIYRAADFRQKLVGHISTENSRKCISETLEFHSWNFEGLKSVVVSVLSVS
jgi:hypothetical protein